MATNYRNRGKLFLSCIADKELTDRQWDIVTRGLHANNHGQLLEEVRHLFPGWASVSYTDDQRELVVAELTQLCIDLVGEHEYVRRGVQPFKSAWVDGPLESALIADIVHYLYGALKFSTGCGKTWHMFRRFDDDLCARFGDIYVADQGQGLKMLIRRLVLPQLYQAVADDISAAISVEADGKQQSKLRSKIQGFNKSCRTGSFHDAVVSSLAVTCNRPQFADMLDSRRDIVAFRNGVVELPAGVLRPGLPSDLLNKALPVDFIEYADDSPEVQELEAFLRTFFPDPELYEYFLASHAHALVGTLKLFFIWVGKGNNGKSVMEELFRLLLGMSDAGGIMASLNEAVLTSKAQDSASSHTAHLIPLNGARLVVAAEPQQSDNVKLNTSTVKRLTGNDTLYARAMYGNAATITVKCMVVMHVNSIPAITENDPATWNRIRVIVYETTYTKDAPTDAEEQARQKRYPLVDHEKLRQDLQRFAPVLGYFFVRELRRNGLDEPPPPKRVMEAVKQYKAENDMYSLYLLDEVVGAASGDGSTSAALFYEFCNWHKACGFPANTKPSLPVFRREVKARTGLDDIEGKFKKRGEGRNERLLPQVIGTN